MQRGHSEDGGICRITLKKGGGQCSQVIRCGKAGIFEGAADEEVECRGDTEDIRVMAPGAGRQSRFPQSGELDEPFYKIVVWNCKSCRV